MTAVVNAIKTAKKSIDTTIFRFDRAEIEKALEAAVGRGVQVRALIAHTNRGGDKLLRKLELRLLRRRRHRRAQRRGPGALPRQVHGRRRPHAVRDAVQLHRPRRQEPQLRRHHHAAWPRCSRPAGCSRPTSPGRCATRCRRCWSSARTTRARSLTEFLKGAKKSLWIYDPKINDSATVRDPRGARAERRGRPGARHRSASARSSSRPTA